MAIDPTHSEQCFRNSIKKFFIDNLYTIDGIFIDFDKTYSIPKKNGDEVDRWIIFHFDGIHYHNNVATGRIGAYMFSRRDDDGMDLSALRDTLYDYMLDDTMPDMKKRVTLYDLAWAVIGGMPVTVGDESEQMTADDDTKYKYMNLYFRYGVK